MGHNQHARATLQLITDLLCVERCEPRLSHPRRHRHECSPISGIANPLEGFHRLHLPNARREGLPVVDSFRHEVRRTIPLGNGGVIIDQFRR
jgi:hypothetical protein